MGYEMNSKLIKHRSRTGAFFVFVLSLFVLGGCNGPFILLPGGQLDGTLEPTPKSWDFVGAYGTFQLETQPRDPYSVNIAYTVIDGQMYINAGDSETQWVKNIAADSNVRVRLDQKLYDVRAERVTDRATLQAFSKAWTEQSIFRRDPMELEKVWIYRLVAR